MWSRPYLCLFTAVSVMLAASAVAISPASSAPAAVAVNVSANYAADAGQLDKDLLLNVSQGGYLTLQNLHVLRDQAAEFAALGMRQIRVDHVFDDAFYDVVRGAGSYDFAKLDDVLRPFIQNGIRPWISLSYMPIELGETPFSPPYNDDYTGWRRAVTAMVDHFEMTFGLSGLNWEVWNEPDNAEGWWTGTADQYNDLYRASAEAVQAADPTAQVGGPGLSHHTAPLLDTWLKFVAANPELCDFVSWHSYGGGANFASAEAVRNAMTGHGIRGKKLYVTEWNTTFGMANGPGQWPDTHQTSSYAANRLFSALDNDDGLAGVFFFTGIEGWTPSQDFNGDLGMITADGRRKAVGNTFAMVKSMGATRLSGAPGPNTPTAAYGLVTKDAAARKVSILLWNNTVDSAPFDVRVDHLPYAGASTRFAVTRSDIDQVAGNSWSDHAAGIANQRPSPNERLRPSSRTVVAPAQTWSTSLTLAANATTLIELTPTSETVGPKPIAPVETTVNLARGGAVSVSSEYTNTTSGWFPAAAADGRRYSLPGANDGTPSMGWTSAAHPSPILTPAGEQIQVDLGSPQRFGQVTLWPRSDQAGDGVSFPADFVIAGSSDGAHWTTLRSVTGHGNGKPVSGPQSFAVQGTSYRYLRVTATRLGEPVTEDGEPTYRFQLAELEVTKQAVNVPVPNPGFESGLLSGWGGTGNGTVVNSGGRSGAPVATFQGTGSGVFTTVTGLQPNSSYTFSGYLRSGAIGDPVRLGVKDHGGVEMSTPVSATTYTPTSVTFTTGPSSTSATVYAHKNTGSAPAWFDDFALVRNL